MGGDNDPQTVASHLQYVRRHFDRRYKTGWYSGRTQLMKIKLPKNLPYSKFRIRPIFRQYSKGFN